MYVKKLLAAFCFSYGGLMAIAVVLSYVFVTQTFLDSSGAWYEQPAIFHGFIVAPAEEMLFRLLIPLAIMLWLGIGYLPAAVLAAIPFGYAHVWAYQGDQAAIAVAIVCGVWQGFVVYYFGRSSEEEAGKLPLDAFAWACVSPGVLLFAMLGNYFAGDLQALMVYVIYSIILIFGVLFSYILLNKMREDERFSEICFTPGLFAAILGHFAFNLTVAVASAWMPVLAAIFCSLAAVSLLWLRREPQ